jgi:hypothetical protein
MKTAKEIIEYLENEMAYCLEMHKESKGKDSMDALQYLIQAATIEGLLDEIKGMKELPTIY